MEIRDQRIKAVFVEEDGGTLTFVDSANQEMLEVPTPKCIGVSILRAPLKYTLRKLPSSCYVVEGVCG